MRRSVLSLLAGTAVVVAVSLSAMAEMTLVQELVSERNGSKEFVKTMTNYLTAKRMKTEVTDGGSPQHSMILLDEKKMITIDPERKTYTEMTIGEMTEQMKAAAALMPEMKVTVEHTGESEMVGKYPCKKIIIKISGMTDMTITSWVTDKIKTDKDADAFNEAYAELAKDIPAFKSQVVIWEEYKKMNGFPVKTVTQVSGRGFSMKTETTLKSVKRGKVDPSVFAIPEGYKKRELGGRM